jgi:hypothetical protein
MDVDLDGEFVTRQVTGLAEDRVGLAGAGQSVPGEELLVGEGAPEVARALEGGPAVELRAGAGIARDDLSAADESKTALVSDGFSDAPRLRYITNLHTRPGKHFLCRKSTLVFHPPGGCRPERVLAIGHAPPAAKPLPRSSRMILNSSLILPCACHARPVEQRAVGVRMRKWTSVDPTPSPPAAD